MLHLILFCSYGMLIYWNKYMAGFPPIPEGRRRRGRGRGWASRIALPTQWPWGRANSRRQWRTEEPGVLQPREPQRVGHDFVTEPPPKDGGWSPRVTNQWLESGNCQSHPQTSGQERGARDEVHTRGQGFNQSCLWSAASVKPREVRVRRISGSLLVL